MVAIFLSFWISSHTNQRCRPACAVKGRWSIDALLHQTTGLNVTFTANKQYSDWKNPLDFVVDPHVEGFRITLTIAVSQGVNVDNEPAVALQLVDILQTAPIDLIENRASSVVLQSLIGHRNTMKMYIATEQTAETATGTPLFTTAKSHSIASDNTRTRDYLIAIGVMGGVSLLCLLLCICACFLFFHARQRRIAAARRPMFVPMSQDEITTHNRRHKPKVVQRAYWPTPMPRQESDETAQSTVRTDKTSPLPTVDATVQQQHEASRTPYNAGHYEAVMAPTTSNAGSYYHGSEVTTRRLSANRSIGPVTVASTTVTEKRLETDNY